MSQATGTRSQVSFEHQQALLKNHKLGKPHTVSKRAAGTPLLVPAGGPSQAQVTGRSYQAPQKLAGNRPKSARQGKGTESSSLSRTGNTGSGSQTNRRNSLSLRARSDTLTQQFLQSLGKMDGPKSAKVGRALEKTAPDPAKVGELYNIKQRAQGITDLIKILRTNREGRQARREAKKKARARQAGHVLYRGEDSSISEDILASDWEGSESTSLDRFPYPLCLSSIIMRLQDILANPKVIESIKQEYRTDIVRLVRLCLEEQRCLMYKMPFFVLNYLTSPTYSHQHSRLDFLNMITKKGRVVDKAFNTKMFLVLVSMTGRERLTEGGNNLDEIFDFLKTLFDFNPECFSPTQTLILLTRICLLGIASMLDRPELCEQVLQIVQFLMKYNKTNTHNQKNLALLALTVMVTNQRLSEIAWNTVSNLIYLDPDGVVCELLEILMLGTRSAPPKNEVGGTYEPGEGLRAQSLVEAPDQFIIRELNVKCFNQTNSASAARPDGSKRAKVRELEEIEAELQTKHKSCLINNFEEIDASLSVEELTCKLECPQFFVNNQQALQVISFDASQYILYRDLRLPSLRQRILQDRLEFVETIERNLDKVKRGAVTILGHAKLGPDLVECSYSVSRILDVFSEVLVRTKNIKLISSITESILRLLQSKRVQLTFEWDQILDIIEILAAHQASLLIAQKKLGEIESLFKSALDLILLGKYPREEVRVLRLYIKVRTKWMTTSRTFGQLELQILQLKDQASKQRLRLFHGCPPPNLALVGLYIDHVLQEEFNSLEALVKHLFTQETNLEVKLLVLEKILQFYKESDGYAERMHKIEACLIQTFQIVFRISEGFDEPADRGQRLSDQTRDNNSNQHSALQLEAIDILAFMAHKSRDGGRFRTIIGILTQTSASHDGLNAVRQQHPSLALDDAARDRDFALTSPQASTELTTNQRHSLKRLIQVFKLKATTAEAFKSAHILRVLLSAFESGFLEERGIILGEIIENIRLSKVGDFCWVTEDYPLMIGFHEYARINACEICEAGAGDAENVALSQEMAVSLQGLMLQLLEQLELGNEQTLRLKQNSLRVFRDLLRSMMASVDSLHQVKFHRDENHAAQVGLIDLSKMARTLVQHIDIETNFECSMAIFEILYTLLGAQNYTSDKCRQSKLLLSAEVHRDILKQITRSVAQSFNQYIIASDKTRDPRALRGRLSLAFAGRLGSPAAYLQESALRPFEKRPGEDQSTAALSSTEFQLSQQQPLGPGSNTKSQVLRQSVYAAVRGETEVAESRLQEESFHVGSQAEPLEYLDACQKTLGLLGYALEADCSEVVFGLDKSEPAGAEAARTSFRYDQRPHEPARFSLINFMFEYLYEIVRNDNVLPHVSFQVVSVLQGVAKLMRQQQVPRAFILELSQILLFRLALPKLVHLVEPFENLRNRHASGPLSFLEFLMGSTSPPGDAQSTVFSYQDSPQAQLLLDHVTTLQVELFQLKSEFVVFQVIQNFLDRLRAKFDFWLSRQTQERSAGCQQHFLANLVDLLQWTRNSEQGGLKKHLALLNVDESRTDRSEFFLLNQSLIQVHRLDPKDSRKVQITIRNSAFNFGMEYEIQNPQQALDQYSPGKNRLKMMVLRSGEEPSRSQAVQVPDIDHKILLQAIHPIVMNEMRESRQRGRSLFSLRELNQTPQNTLQGSTAKAFALCDQLDALIPFNLNVVFVASHYTDSETALDFVSRLGNCEQLSRYAHYFKGLPEAAQQYFKGLSGVVYDKDERDFFVFISDILQEDTDYEVLSSLSLQTVVLGSLTPLTNQSDLKQDAKEMKKFLMVKLQNQPALRVFQHNSHSYVISSTLSACNHESAAQPMKDPLIDILGDPPASKPEIRAGQEATSGQHASPLVDFRAQEAPLSPQRSQSHYRSIDTGPIVALQPWDGTKVSPVLSGIPQTPQYDTMVVQNDFLGATMRRLLSQRRSWASQHQKGFQSPNSFERQRLLQRFIADMKQRLPK